MGYTPSYFCSTCGAWLSFNQVFDSNGVCPKCGAISKGTIVKHIKVAVEKPPLRTRLLRRLNLLASYFSWK